MCMEGKCFAVYPVCITPLAGNRLDSIALLLLSDNFIVIALYDFPASSDRDLQLVKGEKLQVLSK